MLSVVRLEYLEDNVYYKQSWAGNFFKRLEIMALKALLNSKLYPGPPNLGFKLGALPPPHHNLHIC